MQIQDKRSIQQHEQQIRIERQLINRLQQTITTKQINLSKSKYPQYPRGYNTRQEALQEVNNLLHKLDQAKARLKYHIECIDRVLTQSIIRKRNTKIRALQIKHLLQNVNIHERGIHNLVQQYVGRY